MVGVLLGLMAISLTSSLNAYAYDKNYSLHGVRTSFLFGWIRGGPELKYNTSLMYLSNTWSNQERLNFIQRIKNNGDTHIDVYARASSGVLPGGVVDKNENLYVNEIAPRVHNSGHMTINSHNVSQFENHIRAVCKLEKIPLKKICNAEMINIIGDDIVNYKNRKYSNNEFFFDYLKLDIKKKRKMGHLTTLKNQ